MTSVSPVVSARHAARRRIGRFTRYATQCSIARRASESRPVAIFAIPRIPRWIQIIDGCRLAFLPSLSRLSLARRGDARGGRRLSRAHRPPSFTRYEVVNDLTVGKELLSARERAEKTPRCRIHARRLSRAGLDPPRSSKNRDDHYGMRVPGEAALDSGISSAKR